MGVVGCNTTMPLTAGCPVEHHLSNSHNSDSLTYGVNYRRVSNFCPLFLVIGPAFWQNIFSLLFFLQRRWNKKKASKKKKFLHVLNCCLVFYLHLKICSIIFCNLTSIFPILSFFYLTTHFPCKDQLVLNCFFLLSFCSDKVAQEKGKSKFICLFLFVV